MEYIDIERTPSDTAMFVSAQSQMWIFALYELLRTWRSRTRKLIKWKENGAIPQVMIKWTPNLRQRLKIERLTQTG